MKKMIACINGPNLNLLGRRNKHIYGEKTLKDIENMARKLAAKNGFKIIFFQSNHEGALVDFIQKKTPAIGGILMNAGALSHYGYSLRDALIDSNLPIVSVHLSDIAARENFRRKDINEDIAIKVISGHKEKSYTVGLMVLIKNLCKKT